MRGFAYIICLITLLGCAMPLHAQHRQVTRAEYFWDTDPGNGNGTPMLAADGSFNNALEAIFQNTSTLPAPGFHTLGIRVRAANSAWGPVFKQVVEILPSAPIAPPQLTITAGEFFWDTDPGAGNGTTLIAYNGNFNEALESAIGSTTAPSLGKHKLGIRLRDVNNTWGPVYSAAIEVTPAPVTLQGALQITAGECFWGTDPGQGLGTAMIAVNGNFDEALKSVMANMPAPAIGFHKLSMRLRDATNHWGPVFSVVVQVNSAPIATAGALKVTAAELFWDTDPGQGNGATMLALNGNFDEAIKATLATVPAPTVIGFHKLHIRVKDTQNNWGPAFSAVVEVKPNTPTTIMPTIKITAAECYFDIDPGEGAATPMLAFDGNFNTAIEKIMGGNLPAPVAMGYHTLYMRVSDGNNNWGTPYGAVVYIDTTIYFTARINGPTSLCPSALSGVVYTTPAIFGSTYAWSVTGGNIVAGAGSRSVTVNWNANGPYQLRLLECNAAIAFCDSTVLILNVKHNAASLITQTICEGQNYLGYNLAGTYHDTMPAANGCDSIRTLQLTVNPIIRTNQALTVCFGQQYHGYTATGTYIDTFAAATGCDSIRTLAFTVLPNYSSVKSITLCYGGSYQGYTATGTYIDTITHASGCDSIRRLYLTILPQITDTVTITICQGNNYDGYINSGVYTDTLIALSGCDSIRTVYLTVLPNATSTVATTICFGATFEGHNATGVYAHRYTAANGCDSTRTINLTVRPANTKTVNQTICQGQSYLGYSVGGTYTDTFTAANGCDSIRTLYLTVLTPQQTVINQTICYGGSHLGYAASGTYTDTLTIGIGCYNVRVLNLTVLPQIATTSTIVACQGDVVQGHHLAGTYVDTFMAANGCDSIRTLHLSTLPVYQIVLKQTICLGDAYLGYTQSGIYHDTLVSRNGCDSIRTLNLTVLPNLSVTINVTICAGDMEQGYNATGVYVDTFMSANGCDSVRTLILTVLPRMVATTEVFICQGDSIKLGSLWFYGEGIYTDSTANANGCYNLDVTEIRIKAFTAPVIVANGSTLAVETGYRAYQWYYNEVPMLGQTYAQVEAVNPGTYSVLVTNYDGCTIVSSIYELLETGMAPEPQDWSVLAYPNPVNALLSIKLLGNAEASVSLYNGLGQLLHSSAIYGEQTVTVDMQPYASGIYYLKTTVGNQVYNQKITKAH